MSHFRVAVLHYKFQSIDDLLEPYNENMEVPKYIALTREQAIAEARKYECNKDKTDYQCWEWQTDGMETDSDGNAYSTYNPNSKWDYWTEIENLGRVGDFHHEVNKAEYKKALDFWDSLFDGAEDDAPRTFYKPEYYLNRYKDRETYATATTSFRTYAVVTPDGEWHAPGEVGWWGMSTDSAEDWVDWCLNYEERWIRGVDQDLELTIVDCHI